MSGSHITAVFIIVIVLIVTFYDCFAYTVFGVDATISNVLRCLGRRRPFFPYVVAFVMGAIFGHIFLQE